MIVKPAGSRKRICWESLTKHMKLLGEKLLPLEQEKGIIVRFMIAHSAISSSILDRAVDLEDAQHKDILRLVLLTATLARQRLKSRVYIGCMKSGPVIHRKNVKYHEPEFWKFEEAGNKYFRLATEQIYAISKDLANTLATIW